MFRKAIASILAAITMTAIIVYFDVKPPQRWVYNGIHSDFSEAFMFGLIYTLPLYLLIAAPVSLLYEYSQLLKRKKSSFLVDSINYFIAGCIIGTIIIVIFTRFKPSLFSLLAVLSVFGAGGMVLYLYEYSLKKVFHKLLALLKRYLH